jgi:hypothetical protein
LSAFLCCNVAREESVDLIMKEQIMEESRTDIPCTFC